jgi:hypothetical protein
MEGTCSTGQRPQWAVAPVEEEEEEEEDTLHILLFVHSCISGCVARTTSFVKFLSAEHLDVTKTPSVRFALSSNNYKSLIIK